MNIGLVGLGRISEVHLRVLEQLADVDVRGGVDIAPREPLRFRSGTRPVYTTFGELGAALDAVIVSTSTSTHFDVCRDLLGSPQVPARVLVEKPVVTTAGQLTDLYGSVPVGTSLEVLLHAAHAPEVAWAAAHLAAWRSAHGEVVSYRACFADPYRDMDKDKRTRVYVSSWLDSGINALSVCHRLVEPRTLEGLELQDPAGDRYEGRLLMASGDSTFTGIIRTSWDVDVATKSTTLTFADGARLLLDHQQVTGRLDAADTTVAEFRYGGPHPRLVAHYLNAFTSLFHGQDYIDAGQARHLHELILGTEAPPTGG